MMNLLFRLPFLAAFLCASLYSASADAQQYVITLEFSKHRGCGSHCPDYKGGNFNKKYAIPGYVSRIHDPEYSSQRGAPNRNFRAWRSAVGEVTIDFDQGCRTCKPFGGDESKSEGTVKVNYNYGRKTLDRSTISRFEGLGYVLEYDGATDTYHFRPRYPGSALAILDRLFLNVASVTRFRST